MAGLLEVLDLAPAHVIGNSFGGSIALGLAVTRPDLVRSAMPPLTAIIAEDPEMQPLLGDFHRKEDAAAQRPEAGDLEGGTRQFIQEIAVDPGGWELVPPDSRQALMNNALTWVEEGRDAEWNQIDWRRLPRTPRSGDGVTTDFIRAVTSSQTPGNDGANAVDGSSDQRLESAPPPSPAPE